MATIRVHFDGKVFVPDEPVDLPAGTPGETHVNGVAVGLPGGDDARSVRASLSKLAKIAEEFPDDPNSPTDLAAQKRHYLYGHPKQP